MNLKFHEIVVDENSDYPNIVKIFEQKPCRRTVFIDDKYHNIPFPYIYFIFKYPQLITGDYLHKGLRGPTLCVYASLNSVTNFNDNVFQLPFDVSYGGRVCSPHHYDKKVFSTQEELENFSISLWWNMKNKLGYYPFNSVSIWQKSEDLTKANWALNSSLINYLNINQNITLLNKFGTILGEEI